MDIPGVSLLLHEALHILLLGFIKNHMEDSLSFLILPKFPRKTVTGAFINEAVQTQSYSGQSSLQATFKIIFITITIVPLGGLLLGEIKWNRSS